MATKSAVSHVDPSVSLTIQNLIDERIASLTSPQSNTQGLTSLNGQVRSRRRGQGLEFEDLRAYSIGDDIRHVDWKVSARHNQLHTRIFREEKEQRVTLALDFTSPMFSGSNELKAIQAGRMAANFAWHIVSSGGRCGLLIQTDHAFHAVRPALGDNAALAICAKIVEQFDQAKALVNDSAPDSTIFKRLLDRIQMSDKQTGAIIMLADLNSTDDSVTLALKEMQIAKQIVVISIEDPIEYNALPTGVFRYKHAGIHKSISLNKKQTGALQKELDKQNLQLSNAFKQAHVPLLLSRHGIINTKAALIDQGFLV